MSDETVYSILLVVGLFSIANGYMEWREKHFLAGVFFFAAGALIVVVAVIGPALVEVCGPCVV